MYTEICAELGATTAVASTAPYIQFSLILCPPFRSWAIALFQLGQVYYSVSISRGKVTGVSDLNAAGPNRSTIISLQRGSKKAKFRIAWIRQLAPTELQAGVESLEPQNIFWGVDLSDQGHLAEVFRKRRHRTTNSMVGLL